MPIKAVFFDFMGTCLDWHTNIVAALPSHVPKHDRSDFALYWRHQFLDNVSKRHSSNVEVEHIDVTLRKSLIDTLNQTRYKYLLDDCDYAGTFGSESLIRAWHSMPTWPDVPAALEALRNAGLELFVLANGDTRLQLDLVESSGLRGKFDMLFSSQLLGMYKPNPEAYLTALKLVECEPTEAVMVACHAYDLRAAGFPEVGMHTVYVERWTDNLNEDMDELKVEFSNRFLGNGFENLPQMIHQLGAPGENKDTA